MFKLGVVSNPFARACRKNPALNSQLQSLAEKKGRFHLTASRAELAAAIDDFHRTGVDCVGIVGGDGSINLVLSEIVSRYGPSRMPKIVVLGGGTANVLALNIGTGHHPARVLSDFLSVNMPTTQPPQISIPSLQINGRLGFVFANGVAARYLKLFYANKGSVGDAGLLLMRATVRGLLVSSRNTSALLKDPLLRELALAETMSIETDPPQPGFATETRRLSAVFVSTIPKMALGIPLFRRLDDQSGMAELLASGLEGRALALQAARALLRRKLSPEQTLSTMVNRVHIITRPGRPYTVDGELFDEPDGGVTIGLGPRITFCRP